MKYAVLKKSVDDDMSQIYGLYQTQKQATKEEQKLIQEYDEETCIWIEKTPCNTINEYIQGEF